MGKAQEDPQSCFSPWENKGYLNFILMTLFFSVLQVTYLIISVLTMMCHLQRMLPVFSTCCVEMVTKWKNSTSCEGSSEIDVWPEFQNLTGDAISRTAFGSSYQEGRRIFQLQGEQAERLIQSFQTMFIPGYWFVLPHPTVAKFLFMRNKLRSWD